LTQEIATKLSRVRRFHVYWYRKMIDLQKSVHKSGSP